MKAMFRTGVAAFALVAMLVALGGTASAAEQGSGPVFVQTDNPVGNQVISYDRASDGTLSQAGVFNTGGKGGILEGSVVDHLASQGSLAYEAQHRLLLAVNAGSDTVSVFGVRGDRLSLRQVIDSGGSFPVSVAARAASSMSSTPKAKPRCRATRSSPAGWRGCRDQTGR